jgi:hypothetical protein
MPIHSPAWGLGKSPRDPPHKKHVMKHYKGIQISGLIYQNLDEINYRYPFYQYKQRIHMTIRTGTAYKLNYNMCGDKKKGTNDGKGQQL